MEQQNPDSLHSAVNDAEDASLASEQAERPVVGAVSTEQGRAVFARLKVIQAEYDTATPERQRELMAEHIRLMPYGVVDASDIEWASYEQQRTAVSDLIYIAEQCGAEECFGNDIPGHINAFNMEEAQLAAFADRVRTDALNEAARRLVALDKVSAARVVINLCIALSAELGIQSHVSGGVTGDGAPSEAAKPSASNEPNEQGNAA